MNRRTFVRKGGGLAAAALIGPTVGLSRSWAQTLSNATPRTIETPTLTIAYEESGPGTGFPIILLHGFPDDVRAWDEISSPLARADFRVLIPYLRGFGPTRFRDAAAPRMAEQ